MSQSIRHLKFGYSPLLMKPAPYPRHATSGPWPNKTAVFIMREWRHPSVKTCHAKRQLRLAGRDGEPFRTVYSLWTHMCLMSFTTFVSTHSDKRNNITILSCIYSFPLYHYTLILQNLQTVRSIVCGLWLRLSHYAAPLMMLPNKAIELMLLFSSLYVTLDKCDS